MDSYSSPSSNAPPVIPGRATPPPRKSRGWMIIAIILLVLLGISALINLQFFAGDVMGVPGASARYGGPKLDEVIVRDENSANKIVVVDVEGIITSQPVDYLGSTMVTVIKEQLKRAQEDHRVKAVLLKVNSPGGEVLASDDLYRALADFQKKSGKPVVVSMGSLAASGGYYVSAPCRWIVANELTITGSIGVILSSWNYRGLMDKVGLQPQVYKSGKFKNMLSGDRRPEEIPLEEKQMVQGLIDDTYERFKEIVAEGREWSNSKNASSGKKLAGDWENYADGRILTGEQAYEVGLVDELGDFDAAIKRTLKLAGVSNANLVKYQQRFDLASFLGIFGEAKSKSVKVDLGLDVPELKAGHLYFLSPTLLH